MTSRRSFLKSIVAAIALSPALCRMVEKVETLQEAKSKVKLAVNPEYETAAYECVYIYHGDFHVEYPKDDVLKDTPRFNFVNGEFVKVTKHLS